MEPQIILVDVDGTLCNDAGVVPDSAAKAIIEARKNGHLIYLCTGRSKAELGEHIMSIGFDGVIGAGGGYIESQGTVLLHKTFEEKALRELIDYLNNYGIEYYLESNQGLFASQGCEDKIIEVICQGIDRDSSEGQKRVNDMQWFFDVLITEEDKIDYFDVNKVSFINNTYPFEEIDSEYSHKFRMLRSTVPMFGRDSGEIALQGINKATAIVMLLSHLGIDKNRTFALGDGNNDIDMFELVALGVAMGNASEDLKRIADDVTDSHDEHGIYNCFKKYHLI